jgi:hypothetical protein
VGSHRCRPVPPKALAALGHKFVRPWTDMGRAGGVIWAPVVTRMHTQKNSSRTGGPRRTSPVATTELAEISQVAREGTTAGRRFSRTIETGQALGLAGGPKEFPWGRTNHQYPDSPNPTRTAHASYAALGSSHATRASSTSRRETAKGVEVRLSPSWLEPTAKAPRQSGFQAIHRGSECEQTVAEQDQRAVLREGRPISAFRSHARSGWAPPSRSGPSPRVMPRRTTPLHTSGSTCSQRAEGGLPRGTVIRGASSAGAEQTPHSNQPGVSSRWSGQLILDESELSIWLSRHIADSLWSARGGTTGPDPRMLPPAPGTPLYS